MSSDSEKSESATASSVASKGPEFREALKIVQNVSLFTHANGLLPGGPKQVLSSRMSNWKKIPPATQKVLVKYFNTNFKTIRNSYLDGCRKIAWKILQSPSGQAYQRECKKDGFDYDDGNPRLITITPEMLKVFFPRHQVLAVIGSPVERSTTSSTLADASSYFENTTKSVAQGSRLEVHALAVLYSRLPGGAPSTGAHHLKDVTRTSQTTEVFFLAVDPRFTAFYRGNDKSKPAFYPLSLDTGTSRSAAGPMSIPSVAGEISGGTVPDEPDDDEDPPFSSPRHHNSSNNIPSPPSPSRSHSNMDRDDAQQAQENAEEDEQRDGIVHHFLRHQFFFSSAELNEAAFCLLFAFIDQKKPGRKWSKQVESMESLEEADLDEGLRASFCSFWTDAGAVAQLDLAVYEDYISEKDNSTQLRQPISASELVLFSLAVASDDGSSADSDNEPRETRTFSSMVNAFLEAPEKGVECDEDSVVEEEESVGKGLKGLHGRRSSSSRPSSNPVVVSSQPPAKSPTKRPSSDSVAKSQGSGAKRLKKENEKGRGK